MTIRISASQVTKFLRCPRMYSWEYVERIKPPSKPRQEFGSEVHAILAAWLKDGTPPPKTAAGEVAAQGVCKAGVLPLPKAQAIIEEPRFFTWSTGAVVKVVPDWAGFVPGGQTAGDGGEGAGPADGLILDHKTTSDLKWALTPDQLRVNEQAIMYATWAMLTWNLPVIRARWVYYAATNPKTGRRKPAGLRVVETTFDARDQGFLDQIARLELIIHDMKMIREHSVKPLELPPSVESCESFEGCFHRERCGLTEVDRLESYFAKVGK